MACADTGDNLGFIAAALSAMTDKHIVSKSEYLILQQQARSGIYTGYIFKGEVNVPQMIEQTYADTYRRSSAWKEEVNVPQVIEQTYVNTNRRYSAWKVGAVVALGGLTALFGAPTVRTVKDRASWMMDTVQIFVSSSDGVTVCITMTSHNNTIHQLKLLIEQKLGIKTEDQCLSYQGTLLQDTNTLQSYHITNNSTVTLSVRVRGGSKVVVQYLDSTHMDPTWDYDFTNESDGNKTFTRGGYPYSRPCGWKRIAIKVIGKYGDETWLGQTNSKGEWAVSYHGTEQPVFDNICAEGYHVGTRNVYGKGVYSSPDIKETVRYAYSFNYKGVDYLGIFQNRINPKSITIVKDGKYWVCPDPANIRPYGLCVKAC